ncbi:hypothetical protein OOK50_24065 [Streptomyces sp. NBC_01789]|nr:hypothetical protein [Streptomyces sp. NBC_01789]
MRCTLWRRLPLPLAEEARRTAVSGCVDAAVQCQLPRHTSSPHYALVDEAGAATALWLRWHNAEVGLSVLPDCPSTAPGPDSDACCLFAGHAGRHTWDAADNEYRRPSAAPQPQAR